MKNPYDSQINDFFLITQNDTEQKNKIDSELSLPTENPPSAKQNVNL